MKKSIKLRSDEEAVKLYGNVDERLRFAESEYGVRISARNNRLLIEGSKKDVERSVEFFMDALERIRKGEPVRPAVAAKKQQPSGAGAPLQFFHKGKLIQPRSKNQEAYLRAVYSHDVVITIGPAGTGKTYLAMALAVEALKQKQVERIVLTRPAVEAGENLGFLPGDLYAKINPYLRPLYDALYDMMEFDEVSRNIQRGRIEVAPLAYMRGRTLNDAFVILDEAQNCTYYQFKMFLTRLGMSSKMIVTGDVTQIDLPARQQSGLLQSQKILKDVRGIQFFNFDETDVVRHRLVADVIKAYEAHEKTS